MFHFLKNVPFCSFFANMQFYVKKRENFSVACVQHYNQIKFRLKSLSFVRKHLDIFNNKQLCIQKKSILLITVSSAEEKYAF